MAIDPAQLANATGANAEAPSTAPQPQAQQPVFVDVAGLVKQVTDAVKPVVIDSVKDVAAQGDVELADTFNAAHKTSLNLIQDVDNRATAGIAANSQAIQDALGTIGKSFATRLTSPRIQAVLIVGSAIAVWLGCIAILIAYLAGSVEAKGIIGWAGAAFGGSSVGLAVLHQFGLLGATGTTVAQPATAQFLGPIGDTTALKLPGQIPMSVPGAVGTTIVTSSGT